MAPAETSPNKKGNADSTKYDIDNVIPVLLASLGNAPVNYKTIAAMDDLGRTEYAWQHRFRRWKSLAKDILDAHPGLVTAAATAAPKRSPAKKAAEKQVAGDTGSDGDGEDPNKCLPKSGKKRGAPGNDVDESPTKKSKGGKKATTPKVKKASEEKVSKANIESDDEVSGNGVKEEQSEEDNGTV